MRTSGPIALVILGLALTPKAFAHKLMGNHTHCLVADKGVAVTGKTDAERKASCGKVPDAVWDDTRVAVVEAAPEAPVSTVQGEH